MCRLVDKVSPLLDSKVIKNMSSIPLISIVIPTLNEEDNIDLLLQRIFAVPDLQQYDFEVVFSDGASSDTTCTTIRKWQQTHPVELLCREVNEGLSAAVLTGAQHASGDIVVVMDADLSHPPEAIPQLLQPLITNSYDMTIGSRYCLGGATPDWPLGRKIASRLATVPARFFTHVQDPLAGFFALRRERLTHLARPVSGFKIGFEILATAEPGFRVREFPIIFRDRSHGSSKMNGLVILAYCRQLLSLLRLKLS